MRCPNSTCSPSSPASRPRPPAPRAKVMAETPDSRSARLLASLYSPPDERAVIDALLGIERELATSVEAGVDHSVAHARLQWWRDECERAGNGHGVHPLTQ